MFRVQVSSSGLLLPQKRAGKGDQEQQGTDKDGNIGDVIPVAHVIGPFIIEIDPRFDDGLFPVGGLLQKISPLVDNG